MERAAGVCVEWLSSHLPGNPVFVVLCGSGNNGGDGLAITRMLYRRGYSAKAFLLRLGGDLSEDCRKNFEPLAGIDSTLVEILEPGSLIADMPESVIVIDAILGTGLSRPAEGWLADFILHINELPNSVIAVDIPSGMPADSIPTPGAVIMDATHTLSFQFFKRSFLHPETGKCTGYIHLLDIGLSQGFINATHTSYHTQDEQLISTLLRPRHNFSHKGDYGLAYIIAGSKGMMGAAVLAAKAALRSGVGKVRAVVPECGYTIMQTAVPEAMCSVSGETCISRIKKEWDKAAVGIGPGLGMAEATFKTFADFLSGCKDPVVIDADALNMLAQDNTLLAKLPAESILTPHPGEFERLFGKTKDSMQMLELARTQSMKYNIYIVLKGHYTTICGPEGDCWYNMTGNAGMATAGSGDVLTGIITGLLAQGYTSADAARMGVYLHGLAGDLAAGKLGVYALTAGDIIEYLGTAFLQIEQQATINEKFS